MRILSNKITVKSHLYNRLSFFYTMCCCLLNVTTVVVILCFSYPFKIIKAVILLVFIYMVHISTIKVAWNKSLCHNSMN